MSESYTVKLKAGKYMRPVTITREGTRLFLKFGFCRTLMEEVKAMEGARWHGFDEVNPRKQWSIKDCARNRFQLQYLAHPGSNDPENPYRLYDAPLVEFTPEPRKCYRCREAGNLDCRVCGGEGVVCPYQHQVMMIRAWLTYRQCEWAAEMGTGKTLAAIICMEQSKRTDMLWVGPKSALHSVKLEFEAWQAKVIPRFYTYDGLKKLVETWPEGKPPPELVVFDEASRLKNPTAQRTQAAMHLTEAMRRHWGREAWVLEMTGSPAPKSPADWFAQAEIACPGFVREGTHEKFKRRLAIIKNEQSLAGGAYPKLVTWRDDPRKCDECGEFRESPQHDPAHLADGGDAHAFRPSVDEVSLLYKRLKGLVHVFFKKDCFSGDVEALTQDGPKRLRDLAVNGEATLYVQTSEGMRWLKCQVKSFGQQDTYPVTFGDGNTVRATLRHQWLTLPDRRARDQQLRRKMTYQLQLGKDQLPLAPIELPEVDWEGYAHGFVFGDGTMQGESHTCVPLYGHDVDLKPLLLKYGELGYQKRKNWQQYLDCVYSLPGHWKDLPKNPTRGYALGFVLGLVSADGFVNEHVQIYQADYDVICRVRSLATYAGLRCQRVRVARFESPFDGSDKPLFVFTMSNYNLRPDLFLRRDQQAKYVQRGRRVATTVTEVDYSQKRTEEVFCAVVPFYQNFTLANGVISSNCLDLPDKVYRLIECKPSQSTLNAARAIVAKCPSAAQALILLRELSDGFQYAQEWAGEKQCPRCFGTKRVEEPYDKADPDNFPTEDEVFAGHRQYIDEATGEWVAGQKLDMATRVVDCPYCAGSGKVPDYKTSAVQVPCPKEDALRDLLDEHDDVGRIVVFAGFTGSVERCVSTCQSAGWTTIRVDGRGWSSTLPGKPTDLLKTFQLGQEEHPRVAFVGQPGAAGMGLNLTASPTIVYYSNDFNSESRIQSEDRCHRPGMDKNRGCTIVDLCHLPSDLYVLNNLRNKRRLQDMTMGQFRETVSSMMDGVRYM